METTTMDAAAMTAARVTCDAVWIGAGTAHSGDLGQVKGRTVSVVGYDAVVTFAPATGSVYPRLERPPV